MALWGIGKLKDLGGKINLREKLRTYVTQPHQEQENITDRPEIRSAQEAMRIQLIEYQKLIELEREILAEAEQEQQRHYQEREKALLQQLSQTQQDRHRQRAEEEVIELARQVEAGERELRSIIRENVLLREQAAEQNIE